MITGLFLDTQILYKILAQRPNICDFKKRTYYSNEAYYFFIAMNFLLIKNRIFATLYLRIYLFENYYHMTLV
ncbi:hypothetical protein IMSAGC011_03086 [Lachnospiraceae bacterium]|nr:hypothetical protein IMSAGC011_03086 [Lachnospiraceae bacterium]